MGNYTILKSSEKNSETSDSKYKDFYFIKDLISFEISNYTLELSKICNENKIYIKVIEKPSYKFIHYYYENCFNIKDLEIINNYFKSQNTIDYAYKNIINIIRNNNSKITFNNSSLILILIFNESNESKESSFIKLILNKKYQTLNEIKFNKNPNFIYKSIINNTNSILGCNDIFEVYFSYKDNNHYLVSPNYNKNNLEIIKSIPDEEYFCLINELKGHKNIITLIRYFLNKDNLYEYLISSDESKIVIIWSITDNYNIKNIIKTDYNYYLYSCLILFNINQKNIIITSTTDTSPNDISCSKIYSLDNNNFINNIKDTNQNASLYILFWYNIYNSEEYLIECCLGKICIYNIINNTKYCELKSDNDYESYCCGLIYKKNNENYLITTSDGDYIRIWDLYQKKMINVINTMYCGISYIIRWSDDYFIVADQENNSFKVIDIKQLKIINDFKIGIKTKEKGIICIKKIYHPKFKESLVICDGNSQISILSIKK